MHSALLESFSGYSKEWGKPFANWNAIGDLLSTYLLFGTASWVTFLIAILVLITLCRKRMRDAKVQASVCAGCSTLIALVISLKMETPPLRTVAYLATPIAFVLVTLMTEPFREETLQRFRLHMMTAVVLAAFAFALQSGRKFHFRPIEAWMETAQRIEKGFPNGTEVVAQFRPKWLRVYLPGSYRIVQDLDVARFRAGRQIVVDSSLWVKSRFPLNTLPQGYRVDTVAQRRGGGVQWIYSFPPANSSPK